MEDQTLPVGWAGDLHLLIPGLTDVGRVPAESYDQFSVGFST